MEAKQAALKSSSKSNRLKDIYTYINTLISSMEVIPTECEFPSFSELKESPDKFYEMFSEATHRYNIICDTLQKLQHANAMIVKIMNDLMSVDCREEYSVKTQYSKLFLNSKAECSALINCYETAKASSESIVKFYNSAQYVITRPATFFGGTSANY